MEANAVYLLESILDDPRYEGFAFEERASLRGKESLTDDFMPDERSLNWCAPRLATIWKPQRVVGRVRSFNDYPCVELIPAFSQRAVDALRDMLEPNGELLPLISEVGRYYAYNITTVADVLDVAKSDIRRYLDSEWAMLIERYEFVAKRLQGLTIFQIPEMPGSQCRWLGQPYCAACA